MVKHAMLYIYRTLVISNMNKLKRCQYLVVYEFSSIDKNNYKNEKEHFLNNCILKKLHGTYILEVLIFSIIDYIYLKLLTYNYVVFFKLIVGHVFKVQRTCMQENVTYENICLLKLENYLYCVILNAKACQYNQLFLRSWTNCT